MISDSAESRIEIVVEGREHGFAMAAADLSILDAGLDAGLDLPYSCRSGACATCVARVLSGRVEMQQNKILNAEELTAGLILTCQATPQSALVMLSYDDVAG